MGTATAAPKKTKSKQRPILRGGLDSEHDHHRGYAVRVTAYRLQLEKAEARLLKVVCSAWWAQALAEAEAMGKPAVYLAGSRCGCAECVKRKHRGWPAPYIVNTRAGAMSFDCVMDRNEPPEEPRRPLSAGEAIAAGLTITKIRKREGKPGRPALAVTLPQSK